MRLPVAIAMLLALGACATSHFVRPLGKGGAVVNASVGGPLVQLGGATFPRPSSTSAAATASATTLDIFLRANMTAAAFGDLHLEPGVAYHPLVRDGGPVPTVTVAGSLHFLTDFPQRAGRAAALGCRRVDARPPSPHGLRRRRSRDQLRGARLGADRRTVRRRRIARDRRVGLTLEAKYLAPNYNTGILAPTWIAPGRPRLRLDPPRHQRLLRRREMKRLLTLALLWSR